MDALAREKEALRKLEELGYDTETAIEMLETYKKQGGTICCIIWPSAFSWFSGERNAIDVLQETGLL